MKKCEVCEVTNDFFVQSRLLSSLLDRIDPVLILNSPKHWPASSQGCEKLRLIAWMISILRFLSKILTSDHLRQLLPQYPPITCHKSRVTTHRPVIVCIARAASTLAENQTPQPPSPFGFKT